jgi:hypothetical protein
MAKLKVITDVGTFTRTTERTYTHIVVVKGYRAEKLEASRLHHIKDCKQSLERYKADPAYARYIPECEAELATLEARGPITKDGDHWGDFRGLTSDTPQWHVHGWTGRLDLARKLYATEGASRYRDVRIYDVATGKQVRF